MGHLSRDSYFSRAIPPNFRVRLKKNPVRGADFERGKFPGEEGPMATLIGERRRGTLPPVATLKYHDPAMWPVHVAARRFHPPRHQANRSAPACVNFTKVPDSCLTNQPFSMARSMPARYSSTLPPVRRNARL